MQEIENKCYELKIAFLYRKSKKKKDKNDEFWLKKIIMILRLNFALFLISN